MAKTVLMKKLVLDLDDNGNLIRGRVHYQMKVGGVLDPKIRTLGTTNWFKTDSLKDALSVSKQNVKDVEKVTKQKEI